jgi:hypothetical protein
LKDLGKGKLIKKIKSRKDCMKLDKTSTIVLSLKD